jgi:XTP/dITP diphosphohydrolase
MSETFPKELIIATRNAGKIKEVQELLSDLPLVLRSLRDFPQTREVEETGATFMENASLKARDYALQTAGWALSDDSGLEVEALGGAPGLFSARYAGHDAADADRIELLLSELARTGDTLRRARFVCAVALANPAGRIIHVCEGVCEGHIADGPRGVRGFGYDPVFIPQGYAQSFGELSSEIKAGISHRARALKDMRRFLLELLRAAG